MLSEILKYRDKYGNVQQVSKISRRQEEGKQQWIKGFAPLKEVG